MDDLKDKVIKEMAELLQTPSFKSFTSEEISIILYQDVIEPYINEMEKHFTNLAYKYSGYPSESH